MGELARRVLVTGGTGMVGNCIVQSLLARGHHVRARGLAFTPLAAGLARTVAWLRATGKLPPAAA